MVQRCVVGGCSNVKNDDEGISLHPIPYFDDTRPEAVKRRRNWVAFVNSIRKKWTATKYSEVCSVHFASEDFAQVFSFEKQDNKKRLKKDEIGVAPIHGFTVQKFKRYGRGTTAW